MGNKYKVILFDLDHTLWDFETNSRETLVELYDAYRLAEKGVTSFEAFFQRFREVNHQLWDLYDRGLIDSELIRRERFKQVLEAFDAYDSTLSQQISHDYLHTCPQKQHLIPHAIETLEYLAAHYRLSVVTNGFDEIQMTKLASGKLTPYFDHIVTSQKAGCKKPARGIFDYALQAHDARTHEAVMIGDNLITDIGGAISASIDAVYFNPAGLSHTAIVTHEINTLAELRHIL